MLIAGEAIDKKSFKELSYYPSEVLLSFPSIVLNKYFILSLILVMPGMEDQTVTASVLTKNGVLEDQFDILSIDFPSDPSFGFIAPNTGEQKSTITNITITGVNTTFEDDGVDDISLVPSDGLTVSNITVHDNTTVDFDLQIDGDAPLGYKTVVVVFDNGRKFIVGPDMFEVIE